jgi:ATP-dependent Clp protease ATP-binding subunit ClpB
MKQKVLELLKRAFRPELLNRVDETVVFHALDKAELVRIVDFQLDRLRLRLLDKRIELEVTEAARIFLAEAGYDPVYGARPIKRTIQRSLETEIARRLLSGAVEEGRTLTIDLLGAN